MSRRTRVLKKNNTALPFKILPKAEKYKKLNIKLNREGVEMVNAVRRRKESQKQHEILQNRIRHLNDVERRENLQMIRIKTQIQKFNDIRKVQSEYSHKRNEVLENSRREEKEKYQAAQVFKNRIKENIKQKREEMLIRNKMIMEEVIRESDQAKSKNKKLVKENNKSEYKMRIAREKMEANIYNKKLQEMERIETSLVDRLENTQDTRKTLMDHYQSLVYLTKESSP